MRVVIARCSVQYHGRGETFLDTAVRALIVKSDAFLVHSEDGLKPLNYMKTTEPPAERLATPDEAAAPGATVWTVGNAKESLRIVISEVLSDISYTLAEAEPGLIRSGTEKYLQAWIASHITDVFGEGWTLVSREYQTGAGPVDLLVQDPDGVPVAVEVKRTAVGRAVVDQIRRYVESLAPTHPGVRGMIVAQTIRPRTEQLAAQHSVQCLQLPGSVYRD